jgi:hypothetical protein
MKKFFAISCLGCAGLLVIAVAVVMLMGWVGSSRAEFTNATASYEPLTAEELSASADLSSDPPVEVDDPSATQPHRVTLTISGVDEVSVRPCEPGSGLQVDAAYDTKTVEFAETMTRLDDGRWDYTVEMAGSGSQLTRLVQQIFSKERSKLELCLPRDVPIEFIAHADKGGLEAELGGLSLTGLDLSLDMGGGFVNFDSPLSAPADYVTIRANMGGAFVAGLGNASPATLDIGNRFGGLTVDLSGEWKNDATISIEGQAGGATLLIPSTVSVVGGPDTAADVADLVEGAPVLTFAPGTNFKDVTVHRR